MTAEQVVSYLLEEEGLDFLRESLAWVVQQLMEAEVSTSLVIEQNDEWLVGRHYLSLDSLAPLLEERRQNGQTEEVLELTAA